MLSSTQLKFELPTDFVDGALHWPFDEVQYELESLPPLSERRKQWLQRRAIVFDDKQNRIWELPPNHRFTENIGESALVIPITNTAGEAYDFHVFLPRYPMSLRHSRLCGRAIFLNESAITARAYTKERPLQVWWTSLSWLKAGRVGICILETHEADALKSIGWFSAESFDHGNSSFDADWCDFGERVLVPGRFRS